MRSSSSLNPRRLPAQARGEVRRTVILAAAEAVFAEEGFERAGIRDIAARANSSVSSVYHFFDSKESIALALADRYAVRVVEHARTAVDALEASTTVHVAVQRMVGETAQLLRALPALDAIHDAVVRHPAGRALAVAMEEALGRSAEQFLERCAPTLEPVARRVPALLIVTLMHATLERAQSVPESDRPALLGLLVHAVVGVVRSLEAGHQP